MTDDDRHSQLAALAQQGDADARRQLLEVCLLPVRRSVFRVLGAGRPEHDHQEVVQQSLVALLEALPRFRGEAPLTVFAGSIAYHQAQRFLSRDAHHPLVWVDILDGHAPWLEQADPAPGSEQVASDRQLYALLWARLEAVLTSKELLLFQLQFRDGHDSLSCMRIMGISRSHYHQLRHHVRMKARQIRDELD